MKKLFVILLCVLPSFAWAEVADVTTGATSDATVVGANNAGARIGPAEIRTALRVRVKSNAASTVCFSYVDRGAVCATALTDPDKTGFCLDPNGAYVFLVEDEHFRGQVCAINVGAGNSSVGWNAW